MANRLYNKQVAQKRDAGGLDPRAPKTTKGSGKNALGAYDLKGSGAPLQGKRGVANKGAAFAKTGFKSAKFAR